MGSFGRVESPRKNILDGYIESALEPSLNQNCKESSPDSKAHALHFEDKLASYISIYIYRFLPTQNHPKSSQSLNSSHLPTGSVLRQATNAFNEGRDLDPQNPDWDKEAHQGVMALRLRCVSSAVSLVLLVCFRITG